MLVMGLGRGDHSDGIEREVFFGIYGDISEGSKAADQVDICQVGAAAQPDGVGQAAEQDTDGFADAEFDAVAVR